MLKVSIKPGELSYIGVKRTFVKNVPSPYTQCQDLTSYSSELYDFIIKSNKTYRQKDCFDFCIQQLIISKCGCYSTRYPNPSLPSNKTRACLNFTDYICFKQAYFQVDVAKCASDSCPLECDSERYNLILSSATYPAYESSLFVYYTELEYTLMETIPAMTLASLIASLGGTLGLIISVSFFTLLEIVELFVLLTHALLFD